MLLLQGARPDLRRRTSRGRLNEQRASQLVKNPDPVTLDDRVSQLSIAFNILFSRGGSTQVLLFLVDFIVSAA